MDSSLFGACTAPSQATTIASVPARGRRAKKIVLAEGGPVLAEMLPKILKPVGYDVIVATDGEAALRAVKREFPHLIIIDSDLAGIDGFTLCKMLKSDFLTSYIPIVVLIEKRQIRKRVLEIQEGVDDYILKPPDPIDLQVRLEMALRRTNHQVHANSLTRLPGNLAIEQVCRDRIKSGTPFAFMYIDINHFKSFNDTYGYLRGDSVIMQAARIITDCVGCAGNSDDFVGHIGGDDFVAVTTPDKATSIARRIIAEFDRLIPLHYAQQDRIMGYLSVKDRQNNDIKAPLMSVSIAIVHNKIRKISSVIELTEIASEIKKHLKTLSGSNYLVNRRRVPEGVAGPDRPRGYHPERTSSRIGGSQSGLPIGQVLLKAGRINEQQLAEALFEHWSSRELLGQTLIKMGLMTEKDLEPYLS